MPRGHKNKGLPVARGASAGAERRGGVLCGGAPAAGKAQSKQPETFWRATHFRIRSELASKVEWLASKRKQNSA
jgi:hypothetical protein